MILSNEELNKQVKEISDKLDSTLTGHNAEAVLISLQRAVAANTCYISRSKAEAREIFSEIAGLIHTDIKRIFDDVQKIKMEAGK